MDIRIACYDYDLKKLFSKNVGNNFQILSVHKDYINILYKNSGNKIITIVKDYLSALPQGPSRIVINKQTLDKDFWFNNVIHKKFKIKCSPDRISLFHNSEIVEFCFSSAKCYKSKLTLSLKFYRPCFIENIKKIERLLTHKKLNNSNFVIQKTDIVLNNIKNNEMQNFKKNVVDNIGLGKGSTPEFDDFLCGILTSLFIFNKFVKLPFSKKKDIIKKFSTLKSIMEISTSKTTLLSSSFISQFCQEKFSFRVMRLIKLLFFQQSNALNKIVKLILSEGYNSGWWFLYGLTKSSKIFLNL